MVINERNNSSSCMLLLFNCKKDILYVHLTQEVTDFAIAII